MDDILVASGIFCRLLYQGNEQKSQFICESKIKKKINLDYTMALL